MRASEEVVNLREFEGTQTSGNPSRSTERKVTEGIDDDVLTTDYNSEKREI